MAVKTQEEAVALINAAADEVNKRIKSGKLKIQSVKNGLLLRDWVIKNGGIDASTATVESVTDLLERAVKELYQQLEWDVQPKALQRAQNESKLKSQNPVQSESEFEAKKKKGEQADAYKKQQAAAEQRINSLLENFTPINKRGVTDFAIKDRVTESLRQQAAKYRQQGADMSKVADFVYAEIQREYENLERGSERV